MIENRTKVFITILGIVLSQSLFSQKQDQISFGANIVHFNDWKHKPFNFFNPEIRYLKRLSNSNAIDLGISSSYAQAASKDFQNPGDVLQRLIFSADLGFKRYFNHFSAVIGPSLRFRNEKKRAFCEYCPPWEFQLDPKREFVDFGVVGGLNYELFIKRNSSFEIRMAYRLYHNGVSPLSLGVFYNRNL